MQAGATAFMQKPVNNAELLTAIRRALREDPQADEPVVYDLGNP